MKRWLIALCGVAIVVSVLNIVVPATVIVNETVDFRPVVSLGIADQVEAVRAGVVHISKVGVCQGSGFSVAPNVVVTAKHVTGSEYGEYEVTADDGTKYKVVMVVEDNLHDLAYLQIDGVLPVLPVVGMRGMRVGNPVFVMGSPLGDGNFNSVSLGILAGLGRDLSPYGDYGWGALFQTTSPAYPGNSGGPVFNVYGQVIGVLVAGIDSTLNYAVPADFIDVGTVRLLMALGRYTIIDESFMPSMAEWDEYYGYEDW